MTPFKIALFGDIVGKPGIKLMREALPAFVEREGIDFVVANGENLAGGAGTTPDTARSMFAAGVDVLTNGDHVFRRRADFAKIADDERVVRPANLPPRADGHGWTVIETDDGLRVGVVNAIGRVFMDPADCPFRAVDHAVRKLERDADVVVVDFHAEASSEKMAMGWHLDGRVAAVVGTHTHTPTADAQILDRGTAYVSDLGMVGAYDGIIGRTKERVLHRFTTGMPTPFTLAEGALRGPGVVVTIDDVRGLAIEVEPVLLGDPPRTRRRADLPGDDAER